MDKVVELPGAPASITTDDYFGGCPYCGANDGYMNVEREHWFICNRHKTKWLIGSNLFSGWKDEDETEWTRNEYRLENYMEVEPILPQEESDTDMDEDPPPPDEAPDPDAGLLSTIENLTALLESRQEWRPPWALRERLPDRRESETYDVHFGGKRFHVTLGRYPDGRPAEVFLHGHKVGSDLDLLFDDVAVLFSRLLQHGDTPDALAAGLGRLGDGQAPASLLGTVAAALAGETDGKGVYDPYGHRCPCKGAKTVGIG